MKKSIRPSLVCTIGPASRDAQTVRAMVRSGMTVARVNGAHGSLQDVQKMLQTLKQHLEGTDVKILLDMPGNKIRLTIARAVTLEAGESYRLAASDLTIPAVIRHLKRGDLLTTNDGLLTLEVTEVASPDAFVVRSVQQGILHPGKGLHVRGIHAALPFDSTRDEELMDLAHRMGVHWVGVSFVRSPEHVHRIQAVLADSHLLPVVKIETAEALEHLDEILRWADVVMLDRGDLSTEVPPEQVPICQKEVIAKVRSARKKIIVATQFLYSMTTSNRPLISEISDIANAVWDGADWLMLSEETAVGRYPLAAVETLSRCIDHAAEYRRRNFSTVILAAGKSYGFGVLALYKHISLTDIGGKTIIMHQLENMRRAGIREENSLIVIGDNQRQVAQYLNQTRFKGHTLYNPWHEQSSPLVSLWLGRERLTGGFLMLYGDLIFDPALVSELLELDAPVAALIGSWDSQKVKHPSFHVHDGSRHSTLVAEGGAQSVPACFSGLARFTAEGAALLFQEIDEILKQDGGIKATLPHAMVRLAQRGVPVATVSANAPSWMDIDDLTDLEKARTEVYPAIMASLQGNTQAQRSEK